MRPQIEYLEDCVMTYLDKNLEKYKLVHPCRVVARGGGQQSFRAGSNMGNAIRRCGLSIDDYLVTWDYVLGGKRQYATQGTWWAIVVWEDVSHED